MNGKGNKPARPRQKFAVPSPVRFALLTWLVTGSGAQAQGIPARTCSGTKSDSLWAQMKQLRQSDPQQYSSMRALYILGVQVSLNLLGFRAGTATGALDSETVNAVRRFEAANGIPVTGCLTAATTSSRLNRQADKIKAVFSRPPVGMRFITFASWDNGYAKVEGPWLSGRDSTRGWVSIDCFRPGECTVASTFLGGDNYPVPSIDHFEIEEWDSLEILSKPLDFPCERQRLRLNRVQESVSITSSPRGRTCELTQGLSPQLQHGLVPQGDEVWHLASQQEVDSLNRRETIRHFETLAPQPSHELKAFLQQLAKPRKP
jgi:hypothetical protein